MKVCLLLFLIAGAFAVPLNYPTPFNGPIDNDALLAFSLLVTQKQGGDPMELLQLVLPTLLDGNLDLDHERQLLLLSTGGMSPEFAESILTDLMPMLMAERKSTKEQLMTLLFLSKNFCRKGKDNAPDCPIDAEALLPLIVMESERGCDGENMATEGDASAEGEMCLCDEQGDAMFWLNLFEQFSKIDSEEGNSTIPDQFPMAMMMTLNRIPCSGHLKFEGSECLCGQVTKGQEPLLMQYLFTSTGVQERLSDEQRRIVREVIGAPSQRILGGSLNLQDLLFAQLSGVQSPQLLSLLQNQGQSSDVLLRQLILSSIGLDTSLVHIILNGGFPADSDRISLINYLSNLGQIDTSILPLLVGDQNGQNFYITNLIESGSIDPTIGLILLANQAELSQSDIMDILIEAIFTSRGNPDYFTSLGRPYIPPLPEGIFPGSQLFFAHFETLEVNTCALHDLRNRYNCGYIGISAAECETAPYCCYNPIFLTDVEVRNATNGEITSATIVPWCYYNVFFVYFNSFYMQVQRPGGFASPLECQALFKYGLAIDENLYHLFDPSNPADGIGRLINERLECGFPGITEFHCVAIRGCCWDGNAPYRVPQCFSPNGPQTVDFDFDNIPAAYQPAQGTCNVNTYEIPILYYKRVACHFPIEFYIQGYNILAIPNRIDCLTKIGCCYEDNDDIAEKYPFVPRCYQREGGFDAVPDVLPDAVNLVRSGQVQGIFPPRVFPPSDSDP